MISELLGIFSHLLNQSYLPTQYTQMLINQQLLEIFPWYELDIHAQEFFAPEWDFVPLDLRLIKDDF